ncbi:hypothetical protein LCGC14_0987740 [marine sediment metagenome]|uniref:Uncharacterized protein n=1 Tax=marine sediment metagenome TaxID=412755 RepID=A0A0F9N6K4_9ZZZZ
MGTEEKWGFSLLFTNNRLVGINLLGKVPCETIQIYKDEIIKMEVPISIIQKQDGNTYLFPDMAIEIEQGNKIGVMLL